MKRSNSIILAIGTTCLLFQSAHAAPPSSVSNELGKSVRAQILPTEQIEARMVAKYGPWPQIKKWTAFDIQTIAKLPGYPESTSPTLDRYGGREDISRKATGFFRVEKIKDRWWFVDPEGHPAILPGVCNVGQDIIDNEQGIEFVTQQFGSFTNWCAATVKELSALGIRSITSDGKSVTDGIVGETFAPFSGRPAYMVTLGVISDFGRKHGYRNPELGDTELSNPKAWIPVCLPVFDPDWPDFVNDQIQKKTYATRNDPWFIGWLSDNELPNSPTMLDAALKAGTNNLSMLYSHLAAVKFLRERKGDKATSADITAADREAFLELVYDRYYGCLAAAFHKFDPNHLYLGSRLHKYALKSQGILRVAGRHCDVVSINFYAELAPSPGLVALWKGAAGDKALMVTEFYVKGDDLKFSNQGGAGWVVHTQADRGRWYENFVLRLMEEQCFVSWQWFKWRDSDATGSNKGMVDDRNEPYAPLTRTVADVNHQLYQLADYFDAKTSR